MLLICIFMLVIAFERLAKSVWPRSFSPQAVFVAIGNVSHCSASFLL